MSFLEDFEKTLEEKCRQNEPPFCQAACPFHLDIRALEEKWKKGRFHAAYRTYQNTVGFPGIVAALCPRPCEKACVRAQLDAPVSLGLLEEATVRLAKRKEPNAYNLPPKGRKVAVVGGGLSGLGCALRLCNKKYAVTIFEKNAVAGGRARACMEAEAFDREIRNQFQFETPDWRLGQEVTSLEPLREEFEAIYVATGPGGRDFGLEPDAGGAFATRQPGIFMGGGLTGSDPMTALADGLDASLAIERFLKTGGMNEPHKRKGTLLQMNLSLLEKKEPVLPADGQAFTQEEAVREIGRCERCSCDACRKACDLMRTFEKTPRRIWEEVYITIHPGTLSRDGTWATRLITTCDQCGLCKTVCPQHIDFGEFFLQSHRAMRNKGAMPWPFHDFWLRDMAFSSGEARVCRRPPGVEKSRYAFFPGCQMAGSDARYVTGSYAWLLSRQPDTAIWMTCCGAPEEWAGDEELYGQYRDTLRAEWRSLGEPTVIFACPNCRKLFARYLPEIPGVFLSQVMEEWGIEPSAPEPGIAFSPVYAVFDPCTSREFPELQESVRRLMDAHGLGRESLPYEGEKARCCGYGGHIGIAATAYSRRIAHLRSEESPQPYLTYCVNCREAFAGQEKEAIHFLDWLFGINGNRRPPSTVTERRNRRLEAKKWLLEHYWQETVKEGPHMQLEVTKDLERKLSESQILVQDMEDVIAHCEKEGCGAVDPETGHIIGHHRIQHITYWAEYEVLPDGGYRLWNGYSHRMNLEGE